MPVNSPQQSQRTLKTIHDLSPSQGARNLQVEFISRADTKADTTQTQLMTAPLLLPPESKDPHSAFPSVVSRHWTPGTRNTPHSHGLGESAGKTMIFSAYTRSISEGTLLVLDCPVEAFSALQELVVRSALPLFQVAAPWLITVEVNPSRRPYWKPLVASSCASDRCGTMASCYNIPTSRSIRLWVQRREARSESRS